MSECRKNEREQTAWHFGTVMLACMMAGMGAAAAVDVFVWGLDDLAFTWMKAIVGCSVMAPFVAFGLWLGFSDAVGGGSDA